MIKKLMMLCVAAIVAVRTQAETRIAVEDDWVDVCMHCGVLFDEYVTNEKIPDIDIYVDSGSLATLKVTGLPAGLKFTAKPIYDREGNLLHRANTIYGTPTKRGVYTVTVTATTAGKKTDTDTAVIVVRKEGEKMIKLSVQDRYDWETDTSVVPGKVTGAGIYSEGKKVTLKATANRGFVFAGWWDVNDDEWLYGAQDYRSPSLSYIMTDSDKEIEAKFIPVEEDWVDVCMHCGVLFDEYVTNEKIPDIYIYVDSGSLATLKVTGLPTGLKFTAKPVYDRSGNLLHEANTIYGTPKKSGVYTVTVTATTASKKKSTSSAVIVVRKENEKMVKLAVQDWYDEETDTSVVPGKVSGGGIFAEGKKVSLKATANKGFVFAGWWDVNDDDWLYGAQDYRSPSLSYIMTDSDKEIEAIFAPAEEDSDIVLYVDGNEITSNVNDNNFVAEGTTILPLEMDSISIPKAVVTGLPAGMKFTAKALTVKATKAEAAYDVPANAIYGTPTKPGLYTVTVKLTNTTIKKAIEKKFTIEVPNFMAANGYFIDDLDNGIGRKRVFSVGITNIDNFLPSLKLNSVTAKLAVSGLPSGLKYDAASGKITGVATKAGVYTVTLTVTEGKTKYVSTITIEVEALPDWVVGTFYGKEIARGIGYSEWVCPMQITVTISAVGKISIKGIEPGESGTSRSAQLTEVRDDGSYAFTVHHVSGRKGNDGYTEGDLEGVITPMVYGDNVEFGCCIIHDVGVCDEDDDPYESDGEAYQSLYSSKSHVSKLPAFVKNAVTTVNMNYMRDDDWDSYYGGYLTLKYGANGAVTTAYSETEGGKATATGSAQLVPYEVDGNITKAWLYTALKPRGRDPFGVLLFLSIDTSNGNVYGDDVEVDDYLLEVDE